MGKIKLAEVSTIKMKCGLGVFLLSSICSPLLVNALDCWTYKTYFKSDAGQANMVAALDATEPPKCKDNKPSTNFDVCLMTCTSSNATCYNKHEEGGYDSDGTKGDDCSCDDDTCGGASGCNYGFQTGGCYEDSPCETDKDGLFRQYCCTEDKCNYDREAVGSSGKVSLVGVLASATVLQAVFA